MKVTSTEAARSLIASTVPKVVYYHMEGCPHCIKTTPFWNKVQKMSFPYKFYEVEREIVPSEFGIQGFPQFHIREKDGSVRVVEGSRDSVKDLLSALALKKLGGTRKRTRSRRGTRRFVNRIR
jgi:glutaredoxin